MVAQQTTKADVVFRVLDGEVFAMFPNEPYDRDGKFVLSYAHVGQHSGADYAGMMRMARAATTAEYADLHKELTGIGYELTVLTPS